MVGLSLLAAAACGDSGGAGGSGGDDGDQASRPPGVVSANPSLETAADLFRSVATEAEANYAIGPQTIRTVLAMIHAGADGPTKEEIARVLHAVEGDDLDEQISETTRDLNSRAQDGIELRLANGAWFEQNFEINDSYRDVVEDGYGASVEQADFRGEPAAAEQGINKWVSDHTGEKIKKLLAGDVNNDTRAVLVSATYLKAKWADPFDKENTRPAPFTPATGEPFAVPTMHRTGSYATAAGEGWRAVTLPYAGDNLAMTVIVPDDIDGFVSGLDGDTLAAALSADEAGRTALSMPSFEFRFKAKLNPALTDLGMVAAFDPEAADLSKIAAEQLYVSFVQHEAWVKVDEEGSEAAAATAGGASAIREPVTTPFAVDRPFVFVVRDRPTGELLFMGRVLDPRQKS